MVGDLMRRYLKTGLHEIQVSFLLGKPDHIAQTSFGDRDISLIRPDEAAFYYLYDLEHPFLGTWAPRQYLQFTFNFKGRVIDIRISK